METREDKKRRLVEGLLAGEKEPPNEVVTYLLEQLGKVKEEMQREKETYDKLRQQGQQLDAAMRQQVITLESTKARAQQYLTDLSAWVDRYLESMQNTAKPDSED